MFPLKYAWAADLKITRSGKEVAIPGVANVLRSLYGRANNRGGASSVASDSGRRTNSTYGVGADRQLRLSSGDSVNAPKVDLPGVASSSSSGDGDTGDALASFAAASPAELPQFQADTRLNAVLVRDSPQRMAQYERLIASMDLRPRLVEIEVTIMDISSDTLNSLGVDWRAHTPHADFQTGNGNNSPITF